MKNLSESDVVKLLKKRQGRLTASAFAKEIGVSPQYLSDIYAGRRAPGPSLLNFMGLERTYSATEKADFP